MSLVLVCLECECEFCSNQVVDDSQKLEALALFDSHSITKVVLYSIRARVLGTVNLTPSLDPQEVMFLGTSCLSSFQVGPDPPVTVQ